MIFAYDGHDKLGTILLMKFEKKRERDGVEVAIGPVFVATLENIVLNAFGSGNGNEDI